MVEKTSKSGRWKRVVLVSSLALNLVIVGIVGGAMLNGGPKNGPQRFDLTVGPLTRSMDEQHREAVREALHDSGAFQRRERNAMRADNAAMIAALRAETFDRDLFHEVLVRQRNRLQAGQDAVLGAISTQVGEMTAQERAAFADRVEEQLRRSGPRPRENEAGSGG